MKIDLIQHVAFEEPAAINDWVKERGHQLVLHQLYRGDQVPNGDEIDFLIMLGGPMSANDPEPYWLEEERQLIKQLISMKKPILGICLGAQQIVKALGGEVFIGKEREAGWFPVTDLRTNQEYLVFHWHQEQFTLPNGSTRLYTNPATLNQGFRYQDHVIGLQFHLESTIESILILLEQDQAFLEPSLYVQSAAEILQQSIPHDNKQLLFYWLDNLATR
ncbi:type 1 glutamine amidotransferase [Amphibacillus sediminis]|uniref:type 1 glutamine amidotransferase n=1 Tax=Amphibacillus sediminis TaxID=360185 RepID=UPI000832DCA0|nr:type 1 glutamine amidotransferase [Amphibacillus sediminis]